MSVSAVNTVATPATRNTPTAAGTSSASGFDSLVSSLRAGTATGQVAEAETNVEEGQDRFLTLLVAQMKNQDPLSPMDNAQVTSQLAQINTVKGIDKLNASVQKMLEGSKAGSPGEAAAMVGRQVLVEGNQFKVQDGQVAKAGFELASSAASVRIDVLDSRGAVVDSSVRNTFPAGTNVLEWNGAAGGKRLSAGNYSLRVTALNGNAPVTATPLTAATVSAALPGANGISLNLGALGSRPAADVKAYL